MAGFLKFCLFFGLTVSAAAQAQSPDPTRPPAAWLDAAPVGESSVEADGGLRLQSVLQPHAGKPLAVISGRTVALGGRVGDATLVRLSEREAVLQGPEGLTRLYLTPDVHKQMIVTPSTRKAGKAGPVKETP